MELSNSCGTTSRYIDTYLPESELVTKDNLRVCGVKCNVGSPNWRVAAVSGSSATRHLASDLFLGGSRLT